MVEMTERRERILGIVVREHIQTAAPVGSTTIARRHNLGVSPATIRNELAVLEEGGYLTQPHTSAGRVPTVKGYRYFVEQLMEAGGLSPREERAIRRQFHRAGWEPEAWMRLSASVLARIVHNASLVSAPRAPQGRFKHMELVALRDRLILLVLVLRDGTVEQRRITVEQALSQEELSAMADRLNRLLTGRTRHEIAEIVPEGLPPVMRQVIDHIVELMAEVDERYAGSVVHAGLEHILRQPEFAEAARAAQVLRFFEQDDLLAPLLAEVAWHQPGVQVIVGGQGRWRALRNYSLVLAGYGAAEAQGAIGVLGPLRMPYERAVSAVSYVAELMSGLLRELYGAA